MIKTFNFSSNGLPNPVASELKPIGLSQHDAFACLYDAYVDRIHRYIYFRVADDELAEDITAQVFLEAWEKLPVYQTGKSPVIAWLYCLTDDALIDHYRARKTSLPLDAASSPEIRQRNGIDQKPGLQIMPQQLQPVALHELTDKQKQELILKIIDRFRTPEIAGQLDKQPGAACALQVRGSQELAEYAVQKESKYTSVDSDFSLQPLVDNY